MELWSLRMLRRHERLLYDMLVSLFDSGGDLGEGSRKKLLRRVLSVYHFDVCPITAVLPSGGSVVPILGVVLSMSLDGPIETEAGHRGQLHRRLLLCVLVRLLPYDSRSARGKVDERRASDRCAERCAHSDSNDLRLNKKASSCYFNLHYDEFSEFVSKVLLIPSRFRWTCDVSHLLLSCLVNEELQKMIKIIWTLFHKIFLLKKIMVRAQPCFVAAPFKAPRKIQPCSKVKDKKVSNGKKGTGRRIQWTLQSGRMSVGNTITSTWTKYHADSPRLEQKTERNKVSFRKRAEKRGNEMKDRKESDVFNPLEPPRFSEESGRRFKCSRSEKHNRSKWEQYDRVSVLCVEDGRWYSGIISDIWEEETGEYLEISYISTKLQSFRRKAIQRWNVKQLQVDQQDAKRRDTLTVPHRFKRRYGTRSRTRLKEQYAFVPQMQRVLNRRQQNKELVEKWKKEYDME